MIEEISTEQLVAMLSDMSMGQRMQLQHLVGQLLGCCGSEPENMCVAVITNPNKGTMMIHALNVEESETVVCLRQLTPPRLWERFNERTLRHHPDDRF